ncbi:ATPase inhibitor, mitochondrial [Phanerochaete sordida]|uniref:ATPase inhibitor, mitochondrial n=1 Tax=Phanerochaete sordida TaxID=48140 RepID=A0A9P3LI01_9APHY|nr:ATPase inhibitor, mitochondrial [Phanerochaete sordida]
MLARLTAISARRIPRASLVATRGYAENQFNKKEKAHEDQYAREHEKEQLKKLKEQIAAKKAELAELEKKHAEESSKQ